MCPLYPSGVATSDAYPTLLLLLWFPPKADAMAAELVDPVLPASVGQMQTDTLTGGGPDRSSVA